MALSDFTQGIRDFYYSLEDKYYDFLEWLDEKGIPVFKITDPIDKHFPSFVLLSMLFILAIILIIVASWGSIMGLFTPPSTLGILKVTDSEGNELQGITVRVQLEGKPEAFNAVTGLGGIAKFDLAKQSSQALISIQNVPGFEDYEETLTLIASQVKRVQLVSATAEFGSPYELRFKDSQTDLLVSNQSLTISYDCSQSASATPAAQVTENGKVTVQKTASCGTLTVTVIPEHSYNTATAPILETPQDIYLEKTSASTDGELSVHVVDGNNHSVSGVKITIGTSSQPSIQQGATNASGEVGFTLVAGQYMVSALKESDGRNAQTNAEVIANELTSIDISIGSVSANSKKILLKIVDRNSQQPVEQATVTIYKNSYPLPFVQKQSNFNGIVEQPVSNPLTSDTFSAVITHSQFLVKIVPAITLKTLSDQNAVKIELDALKENPKNYGKARAIVSSETESRVQNASVYVYRNDYQNPLLNSTSDAQGEAIFSNLPPTTGSQLYFVKAVKLGAEGTSEQKTIATNTVDFPVQIILGSGRFRLTVIDYNSHQSISNALVTAFTTRNGQKMVLDQNNTDANGSYLTQPLRIQQTVYFEAFKTGYLTQTTTGYEPGTDQNKIIPTISLIPEGALDSNLAILFVRLRKSDGSIPQFMQTGTRYKAGFVLVLPNNTTYNNSIVHLEAGDRDKNTASQNPVFIRNAETNPLFRENMSFSSDSNSNNPFADYSVVASGTPAKQVNIHLNPLSKGAYEFNVEFETLSPLADGTPILLYYQAKAQAPVTEILSPLELKSFAINAPVCEQNCNTFFWRAFYALSGSNESGFKEIFSNPRPQVWGDYNYDIRYEIYNSTNTSFQSNLSFSSDPSKIRIQNPNGFSGQTIQPKTWFEWGKQNPQKITPKNGNDSNAWLLLDTSPLARDSNRYRLRFQVVGSKPMKIESVYETGSLPNLKITVTDKLTGARLANAKVEVQVMGSCPSADSLDAFQFTTNPDVHYATASTSSDGNESGIVRFLNYHPLLGGECLIVRASNVDGYFPATIIQEEPAVPHQDSEFGCIQIDANPTTPGIDVQYPNANRGYSSIGNIFPIKIISQHCKEARVCLHTLDEQFGQLIQTEESKEEVWFRVTTTPSFEPTNFVLGTDENKTVIVHIGKNAPLGYIPVLAIVANPEETCQSNYASYIEFIVTPTNSEGMGAVRKP